MRVCAQTTELDFHILRAIVGMHVETPVEPNLMRAAVMDGTMDPELYKDLAAVAASLFARMAVKERSDGGRARRTGVRAPSIASFGAKGLTAPRFVVAQLVLRAMGVPLSRCLCKLEHGRLAVRGFLLHALLRGVLPDGTAVVLVRLDVAISMRWVEEAVLRSSEAGVAALAAWEALELPSFGLRCVMLNATVRLPVPVNAVRQCSCCGSWRSVQGGYAGKAEV